MYNLNIDFKKNNFSLFVGYLFSGVISTIVHYSILLIMVELLNINEIFATSLGYCGGLITGFHSNKFIVFRDYNAKYKAFFKYFCLSIFGAFINGFLLWLLLQFFNWHYLILQIIVTLCIMGINFRCYKKWIFK